MGTYHGPYGLNDRCEITNKVRGQYWRWIENMKGVAETTLGMGVCLGSVRCDICGKDFTTNHIRNHHGIIHWSISSGQSGMCRVCGSSPSTNLDLPCHMGVRHRSLLYPCATCGRSFNRKQKLLCHVKVKHWCLSVFSLLFMILPLGSDMPTIPCKPILICVVWPSLWAKYNYR